jgi:hypothetical protein|tara:strand:+ start:111 stop:404 length:294 start_codon:yes stop_codon:yes gene_type:complete
MTELECIKRQAELHDELQGLLPWVNGSLIETTRKQGEKESPFYYLSQTINKKVKTTYVSVKQVEDFRQAVDRAKHGKKIFQELSELNIQCIKNGWIK